MSLTRWSVFALLAVLTCGISAISHAQGWQTTNYAIANRITEYKTAPGDYGSGAGGDEAFVLADAPEPGGDLPSNATIKYQFSRTWYTGQYPLPDVPAETGHGHLIGSKTGRGYASSYVKYRSEDSRQTDDVTTSYNATVAVGTSEGVSPNYYIFAFTIFITAQATADAHRGEGTSGSASSETHVYFTP